ncbi:hypothetical protein EBN03_18220 [Nocardia stercoris]|uniref:Uncharacterized protein n=1 Tax=Nocardia stercoris TaxID=2483361 RepID=A0A3M2L3M0_9NOCA|nr:hypothetical protein [Nocardia stercoris]RMI31300.1 hypothetical protein EBN03_18220 [Nocardia stercoris]
MRKTDRIDSGLRALAAAIAVATIPVAVLAGTTARDDAVAQNHAELGTRFAVTATVLDPPAMPPMSGGLIPRQATARAVWGPCPLCGSGPIEVGWLSRPGDKVQVWVGPDGRPAAPPAHRSPDAEGVDYAFGVLSAGWWGAVVLALGGHWLVDRRRYAALDVEWRRLGQHTC